MKNAFIIHGTEGYPEENWFPWLKTQLETEGYEVFVPQFPSPPIVPAKIDEWFDVFKTYEDKINKDTLLIGHSLGGLFSLRILEKLVTQIDTTVLVSAPVGILPILNYDRDSAFCGFDLNWHKVKNTSTNFIIFQSDNDPYVSLGNGKKIAEELNTELSFVPNAGHFNAAAGYTKFPELMKQLTPHL